MHRGRPTYGPCLCWATDGYWEAAHFDVPDWIATERRDDWRAGGRVNDFRTEAIRGVSTDALSELFVLTCKVFMSFPREHQHASAKS